MIKKTGSAIGNAMKAFKEAGGILRTSQAQKLGIHPRTLYALRDTEKIEVLGRGLFRLNELPQLKEPDLITIAMQVPHGAIGLLTALNFYHLTDEIPHQVFVLLKKETRRPKIKYPPTRYFWIAKKIFELGLAKTVIDKKEVQITDPERTIVDCFKFRSAIGLDVAIAALKKWHKSKNKNLKRLIEYAIACRVEKIMRPYLEALQ